MPLYKTLTLSSEIKVLIWKIDESLNDLYSGISLTKTSKDRISLIKSDLQQKGFLSIRYLLKEIGYADTDLKYDKFGKPHLKDGKYISISHSFSFAALIFSSQHPVGIDIEKRRAKIVEIAPKFTSVKLYKSISNFNVLIRKLTVVWAAKESLYKIYGKKELFFLEHIHIDDFLLDACKTSGKICYKGKSLNYLINFMEIEDFTCVYAY
ncbi:MAG: 4'-phosphopantetheinyl transferase family protein [Tenacibaculum sp.]